MASSAVNKPTNVQQKESDINAKLQLFGLYSAFANGKVPTNKQIDIALNSALESRPLKNPSNRLSDEGKVLVADLREVIRQAKHLFLTKNEGNLLQEFIWASQSVSGGDAKLPNSPVNKETAQQHGNDAAQGLRTLGTLILSNGQFRKLLTDASVLLRDMAGDAAQNAATRINPSEEQLAKIDAPAADNTWHDVPSVTELKGKANELYNKNKPFTKADAKDAAADAAAVGTDANTASKTEAAKAAAATGKDNLAGTAKSNVPAESQEKAKENKQKTKEAAEEARRQAREYLGKKVPKERRDQTIWRLKKMIVEIQGHDDYKQAIQTLLTLAETYGGHGKDLSTQGVGTVQGAHTDESLKLMEANLKTLIERFANSTSSDDLFDALKVIYKDAQSDPELRNWFKAVDAYIRKALLEEGYVIQDASTDEANRLYDQGQFLLRERYRDHTNRLLDEFKFLGTQFEEDPQNKAFGNAVQKLFLDLGNDKDGKPTFKKHLVTDLTKVILPALFENVRYVPIPRIEVSDPQVDVIVENLVVESDNLMPNSLEVTSDNFFRWGRKTVTSVNKNKVVVAVSGVQMDLRDVSYYIKRKQGFPAITDKGVMDIFLGGEGFSFKLGLETAEKKDRSHFFKVNTVKVDIKNLKLKVKQSNHKLLFGIAKPLLMSVVKPALTKVIEKQLTTSINEGDGVLYELHLEAQKALEDAKDDPENTPNFYARYSGAVQKRVADGKKKKEAAAERAKQTQTNVAMTQQDSIFKDIKLPGGISTKATEYKELAAKGDKWESPVFGIGSAKESTDIAKCAQVQRKPHTTTHAALRDGTSASAGPTNGTANPIKAAA